MSSDLDLVWILHHQVADTLEDSAAVIGFEQCMSLLVGPLAELSSAVAQGQPFDWAAAEAVLFCVRQVVCPPATVQLDAG
eukprot:scaffold4874_cov20-Tisochrysis_lutea.AAC.3